MKKYLTALALACAAATAGAGVAGAGGDAHAPILITGDAGFTTCGCVVSGDGTSSHPYVIGPWSINNANGTAVTIIGGAALTKSFDLHNLTIAGNRAPTSKGIVLNGVSVPVARVSGTQTSIQTNNIGIVVSNSNGVTLDGGGANPNGPGIGNKGAGTINKNASGAIDVENSTGITVRGWQTSANGADNSPDWVSLDPGLSHWGVGGVRFFADSDSMIDHNAANNDTSVSYSLFDSSNNSVTNNTANYPFAINLSVTDGSSFNTISGNVLVTSDFIGLLIGDGLPGFNVLETYGPTHDNTVVGNTVRNNGPIGNELSPVDIAPAFLGGIVVLNGTYGNTIRNNQTWASYGSDLAWAQAVPDSSSAIGVATFKPTLHCNVTLSSGGGGVGNLNGNVWSGNTYRTIDACLPPQ